MNQSRTKTVGEITIEPVYRLRWYGNYSSGEYSEVEFSHFTDDTCRELQKLADSIFRLPPIPWEATPEELESHELATVTYNALQRVIESRQELLSRLYPHD